MHYICVHMYVCVHMFLLCVVRREGEVRFSFSVLEGLNLIGWEAYIFLVYASILSQPWIAEF